MADGATGYSFLLVLTHVGRVPKQDGGTVIILDQVMEANLVMETRKTHNRVT